MPVRDFQTAPVFPVLEEDKAKHQALQQAVTAGLASGIGNEFSMAEIQDDLDREL
jgi:hypothetical protein